MLQSRPQNAQTASRGRSFRGRSRRCPPSERSRSSTRCQRSQGRPCAEIDLREKTAEQHRSEAALLIESFAESAKDLISDLVEDAVDEIATDNFVHDVDISFPAKVGLFEMSSDLCDTTSQFDTKCEDLDDIYSLVSESSDDLERVDEEIEELAYCHIAAKLAQNAVANGCLEAEEWIGNHEGEQEIEDWGNTPEDTFAYWEDVDMEPTQLEVDVTQGLFDTITDVEGDLGEFWGDDCFAGDRLAFAMTQDILGDAFEEAALTWERQLQPLDSDKSSGHDKELPSLSKLQDQAEHATTSSSEESATSKVRESLDRSLKSGDFSKELSNCLEADRWSNLQQKVHISISAASNADKLASIFREAFESSCQPAKAEQHQPVVVQPAVVQLAPALAPKFRTTCVATFKTKPISVSPLCALVAPTNMVEEKYKDTPKDVEAPPTARSSARSRRRIIGAVVRTPALEDQECADSQPAKKLSKSKRKQLKPKPDTYSMDLSGGEGADSTRESSITRGYSALGAKHYSLDNDDKWLSLTRNSIPFTCSASSSAAPRTKFHIKVSECNAPTFERPSSKAGSRLRAASMSAMAIDLGIAGSDARSDQNSMPVGGYSLCVPKAKLHAGLLPMLPSTRKSTNSIAVAMQMSKSASKWCNVGMRGSASAVF